jgi:hypothetical protein
MIYLWGELIYKNVSKWNASFIDDMNSLWADMLKVSTITETQRNWLNFVIGKSIISNNIFTGRAFDYAFA